MVQQPHKPLALDTSRLGNDVREVLKSLLAEFGCPYKEYDRFWQAFPKRSQSIPANLVVAADLSSAARRYHDAVHHAWTASVRKSQLYFLLFVITKDDERYADVIDDIFRHSDARVSVCRGLRISDVRSCLSGALNSFDPTTLSAVRYLIPQKEFLVEFNDGFTGFLSPDELGIGQRGDELVFESASVGSNGQTIELLRNGKKDLFEIDSASARAILDQSYRNRLDRQARNTQIRVGQVVRDARLAAGLSQVQLAEQTGIDQALISKLERGQHQPRFDTLDKIARSIGLSVSELLATWPS